MKFEDVMLERLADCGKEACREVLAAVKRGRRLEDAVLDTIEALPLNKTRELRRWVEDWEAWSEWTRWQKDGWHVKKIGSHVIVKAPRSFHHWLDDSGNALGPSDASIAAAVGAQKVSYLRDNSRMRADNKFEVPHDKAYEATFLVSR